MIKRRAKEKANINFRWIKRGGGGRAGHGETIHWGNIEIGHHWVYTEEYTF